MNVLEFPIKGSIKPKIILTLPTRIKEILKNRFLTLNDISHSILGALAVINQPISIPNLLDFTGLPSNSIIPALTKLSSMGIINRREGINLHYSFSNNCALQAYYENINQKNIKFLHLKAAKILLKTENCKDVGILERLAHHYSKTGEISKAINFNYLAGEALYKLGAAEKSLEHYKKAFSFSKKSAPTKKVRILEKISNCQKLLGQLDDCIKTLLRADKIQKTQVKKIPAGIILELLGDVYRLKSNFKKAYLSVRKAEKIYKRIKNKAGLARLYEIKGKIKWCQGLPEEALKCHKRALVIRISLKEKNILSDSYLNLGLLYWDVGKLKKGKIYTKKAFLNFDISKNYYGKVLSLNNLGLIEKDLGNLNTGLKFLKKGKKISESFGYKYGFAISTVNMAEIFRLGMNIKEGMKWGKRATKVFKALGDERGENYSRILIFYNGFLSGNYDYPYKMLKQAKNIGTILKDNTAIAFTHLFLAEYWEKLNNSEKAIYHINQFNLIKNIGQTLTLKINSLCILGKINIEKGNLPKAHFFLKKAETLSNRTPLFEPMIQIKNLLGRIFFEKGEFEKSIKILNEVKQISLNSGFLCHYNETLKNLIVVSLARNDYDKTIVQTKNLLKIPCSKEIHSLAHFYLGKAYFKKENFNKSRYHLNFSTSLIEEMSLTIQNMKDRKKYLAQKEKKLAFDLLSHLNSSQYQKTKSPIRKMKIIADQFSSQEILEQISNLLSNKTQFIFSILKEIVEQTNSNIGIIYLSDSFNYKIFISPTTESKVEKKYLKYRLKQLKNLMLKHKFSTVYQKVNIVSEINQLDQIPQKLGYFLSVPIIGAQEIFGIIFLEKSNEKPKFNKKELFTLVQIAKQIKNFLGFFKYTKDQIFFTNKSKNSWKSNSHLSKMIGKSQIMGQVIKIIRIAIRSKSNILITGESGTGKEITAKIIHENGSRKDNKFVTLDLGSIPESLAEGELFGYARGSFTGASTDKPGLFEVASGGTLFLDEISNCTLSLQGKLLRAIQEGEIRRLGENFTRKIDVRILAASNKNLQHEIRDKRFRSDLYYRLNVIQIILPPLRERREDIPSLANHFLRELYDKTCPQPTFSQKSIQYLINYSYPGNIRELRNMIERGINLCSGNIIEISHLSPQTSNCLPYDISDPQFNSEKCAEQIMLERILKDSNGNKTTAAKRIGWNRQKLYRKIKIYGIPVNMGKV